MKKLIILFFLLIQPAFAQYALEKIPNKSNSYIVKFDYEQDVTFQLRQNKSEAFKSIREIQQSVIDRFKKDLEHSDMSVVRNLWIRQSIVINISERFLSVIKNLPYVAEVRVDPHYKVNTLSVTNLPISGQSVQDNLEKLNIDLTWDAEYTGQGVVVAILDSGVDVEHEDLSNQYRGGNNSWFDAYQQQTEPKDLTGHGTSVASIILGRDSSASYIGVAPNTQWIAARIFDNSGVASESAISETLQWVADPDSNPATNDFPDIVQNSWGMDGTEGACVNPFQAELAALDALGIDIVFSVGNSGQGGYQTYLTPAFDSNVISVGAIDDDNILLSSSSRGPNVCNTNVVPSLVASGKDIKVADLTFGGFDTNNTSTNTGTSFSAPHIAGVLSLLRSQFKAQNHRDYRSAVYDSAISLGFADDYGRGVPHADNAVALLNSQSVPLRANEFNFSETIYNFSESDQNNLISVIRSGDLSQAASVTIETRDGSAKSSQDYQLISTNLSFAIGESIKQVAITLIDDSLGESNEDLFLVLSQNLQADLGSKTLVRVIVEDNDGESDEDEIGGAAIGIIDFMIFGFLLLARRLYRCNG